MLRGRVSDSTEFLATIGPDGALVFWDTRLRAEAAKRLDLIGLNVHTTMVEKRAPGALALAFFVPMFLRLEAMCSLVFSSLPCPLFLVLASWPKTEQQQ